jgi:hypothetical protein
MPRITPRPAVLTVLLTALAGCSGRPEPATRPSSRIENFRVIKFAGDTVVVPFRRGLSTAPVAEQVAGEVPKVGDRVALGDSGKGEVFLALDLDALKFYHSTPGPDQLERFRRIGDEGRLFVVARGTAGTVSQVLDGELPEGLKAVELELDGPKGGRAWVGDPFVHGIADDPR